MVGDVEDFIRSGDEEVMGGKQKQSFSSMGTPSEEAMTQALKAATAEITAVPIPSLQQLAVDGRLLKHVKFHEFSQD